MTARPILIGIDEDVADGDVRVTITLTWEEGSYRGEAVGPVEEPYPARLAGEATLRAVESVTGGRVDLELMAVATQDLGPVRIALAQVRLGGDEVLVGTAVVDRSDPELAAARAALDAVNRRVGLLL